jgi:hypothetical protein
MKTRRKYAVCGPSGALVSAPQWRRKKAVADRKRLVDGSRTKYRLATLTYVDCELRAVRPLRVIVPEKLRRLPLAQSRMQEWPD